METKGASHKKLLNRVKRAEGQVRGISNMIESEKYCIEILTQIKAARSALKSIEHQILENHLNSCVKAAMLNGSEQEADLKIEEIMDILKKANRS